MKRLIGVILAVCAIYVGYAAYAIVEIANGIESGDSRLLASHVDFPAVRESLNAQLRAAWATAPDEARKDGMGNSDAVLTAALRSAMASKVIDILVSPSALAAVMAKRRAEGVPGKLSFNFSAILDRLSIDGPAQIRLGDGDGEQIVLALRDWRWKVVDIRASPEKLRQAEKLWKEQR